MFTLKSYQHKSAKISINQRLNKSVAFIILIVTLFLVLPSTVLADTQDQVKTFFVDSSYDYEGREQVLARLEKISQQGYFYLEDAWFQNLTEDEKVVVTQVLDSLGQEFDQTVYPELTSIYGQEWKPGIDNDEKVTIFFHQMKKEAAGYFRIGDEYLRIQSQNSNEREMLYLNANYLSLPLIKSYLAHEFTHLITFNQKDRLRGVEEEVWLNEARADYASTLLGYDAQYPESNLQKRVRAFIENHSDSLTEWTNKKEDYGVVNMFVQYLVEQYGVNILADSLRSSKIGIPSINGALRGQTSVSSDFSQVFTDWAITVFLNDCQIGQQYCYKNKNLKNIKIVPSLILLPATQRTEFSLDYNTSAWSGNWYRIMGGGEVLTINFQGDTEIEFKVPYVLCQKSQACSIGLLELDKSQAGEIAFEDFGKKYISVTLIPFMQSKTIGFNGEEPSYNFSIFARSLTKNDEENKEEKNQEENQKEKPIEELKTQIAAIKAQIAEIQAKIAEILKKKVSCSQINQNLYFGQQSSQVRCLQEFLSQQGKEVYPEGLVTGFFGTLTQRAVIRFQEKYAKEILHPLGFGEGTGFVGISTRSKINKLLNP